jgi:pimeloyl-ACP methyl ester carboxylesterase
MLRWRSVRYRHAGPSEALVNLVKAHWGLGSVALAAIFLPGASPQDSEDFSRNQRDWANAQQAAQLLRLSCEMSAVEVLSRVRSEALVIHRRKDRAIPLEAGERLAAGLPRARLVTLDGDIHLPWIDGDAIADTVYSFLAGNEVLVSAVSPRHPAPADSTRPLERLSWQADTSQLRGWRTL